MIRKRELSPVEVMKAHLDLIEALDLKINFIVTIANTLLKLQSQQKML
jgi:aspartyl-tRNA(Asn)/glutamyl-tRNA(Gln) amidotransferase subunit A